MNQAEMSIAKKKPTLDDLTQMSNEADWEQGDVVVFSMKNHPKYRFDLQGELEGEEVRVNSRHAGTDHSGYLNIKVDDIQANIDGAAIVAVEDDNQVKSMVGWSSEDEIYPPKTDDKDDTDQVRMRHLAGVDNF